MDTVTVVIIKKAQLLLSAKTWKVILRVENTVKNECINPLMK